jgi:hypothetical protein
LAKIKIMKIRNENESEERIQNSEYLMPEVRVNAHGDNFLWPTVKIGGFKPRFSILSHRIPLELWLLNSEFFFSKSNC